MIVLRFKSISTVIFILICFCFKSFSAVSDTSKIKNHKIGILPILFFTPETKLGFGGFVYNAFRLKLGDSITRKSITQSYLTYTLNKQFAFENDYQVWIRKNRFYFTGVLDYSMFPQFYFGIGNDTRNEDRFLVAFSSSRIKMKNLMRLFNSVYGGLFFHFEQAFGQDDNLKRNIKNREVFGAMSFDAKGIGPLLIIDLRDNPLNPSHGLYFETSYMDYKSLFNNEHMFFNYILDMRKYATIVKKIVWNANVYLNFNVGEVPFRLLPEIGGPRFLRGYYRGRFKDNNMFVIQQEFRIPLYKRFGAALFGGIGAVAKTSSDLLSNTVHYNYGLGLRFKMKQNDNANIRLDFGLTKDSHGLYLVFAEAF
jgi:hypothetical protein